MRYARMEIGKNNYINQKFPKAKQMGKRSQEEETQSEP